MSGSLNHRRIYYRCKASRDYVRQHDIAVDRLPAEHFDLAHARAVLQHVPAREQALANMVAATKPGGWVVIEDVDWLVFDAQDLPEPFATLQRTPLFCVTSTREFA